MNHGLTSLQSSAIVATLATFDCAVIYLFGSFGKPSSHPGSDIDIAFLPARAVEPLDCFYLAGELSDKLGKHVDLVDLSSASTVFAKEVVSKGTALFIGNPVVHQTFEMYTLSDYARLNEERKAVLAI